MKSLISEIKDVISKDKRKNERLALPFKICYSVSPGQKWIKNPVRVKDISGQGLKFMSVKKMEASSAINLKLIFPEKEENDILVKGTVIWCEKAKRGAYTIGVNFHKMYCHDRKRFIDYIAGKLLLRYLTAR